MNKIGLIIKREYLTRVRKRSFLILTFLGPILMAAIYIIPIMLALNSSTDHLRVAVVDESHWFEDRFSDTQKHTFVLMPGQPIDSVKEMVKTGIFDMALYVPPTQLNIPSNAIVYSLRQVPMEVEAYISNVMEKEIEEQKLMANGVDPEIVNAVKTNVNLQIMRMDEKGNEKETFTKVQFTLGIILAMLVYMFIIFFGGQVMQGVAEEKTPVNKIHSTNWVRATNDTPMTLPIISWKGFTELIITSMMRLVFSSATPCITCPPKKMMNM